MRDIIIMIGGKKIRVFKKRGKNQCERKRRKGEEEGNGGKKGGEGEKG